MNDHHAPFPRMDEPRFRSLLEAQRLRVLAARLNVMAEELSASGMHQGARAKVQQARSEVARAVRNLAMQVDEEQIDGGIFLWGEQ